MGQILKSGTHQLENHMQSSNSRITIFSDIWQRLQPTITSTSRPMQHFLGDPDSGKLNLDTHRLAIAIAKKTLDKTDLQPLKRHWQDTNQPFK